VPEHKNAYISFRQFPLLEAEGGDIGNMRVYDSKYTVFKYVVYALM
jgi:hypothetical protein